MLTLHMNKRAVFSVLVVAAIAATLLALMAQPSRGAPSGLTNAEVGGIIDNAVAQADATDSLLRVDGTGDAVSTRMHIAIVDRTGKVIGFHSMDDAWAGSIAIAKAKAYTAMAFSSDENALTSRSIGELSQPGGALWQIGNVNLPGSGTGQLQEHGIIEFPGGIPLYKDGTFVGAIGVSGDGVDQDEAVAAAGAAGYEPQPVIRIDCVTGGGVNYTVPAPGLC